MPWTPVTLVKVLDLFSGRYFNASNKIHRISKGTKYIEIQFSKIFEKSVILIYASLLQHCILKFGSVPNNLEVLRMGAIL